MVLWHGVVKLETWTAGSKMMSSDDMYLGVLLLLDMLVDNESVCMI
jgi:hypothetical protein